MASFGLAASLLGAGVLRRTLRVLFYAGCWAIRGGILMSNGLAKWDSLVKRMAGIAERECKDKGFAVMTIDVLVDASGEPAFWSEPTLVKIEPRIGASVFMDRILKILTRANDLR